MQLSRRVQSLKPSSTLAIAARAKALKAQGVDILSFSAGEPDFDTPEPIKQAAIDALHAGMTRYVPVPGDPETRAVLAHKLTSENNLPGLTADHVIISAGGKHSLYLVMQALLEAAPPGQPPAEVILPTPAWVSYPPQVQLAGARLVEIETNAASRFKITPDQLAAAITENSRLLILNSPSNPTGVMYTPDELRALAKVVAEAAVSKAPDLVVVSDELYEKIIYSGIEHLSFGAIPEVAHRTITINGLSKAYAMTGWRIGYAAMPGEFGASLCKAVARLQSQMNSHITSFCLPAIRTAVLECSDYVEQMRLAFAKRAELITSRMAELPGMQAAKPDGAFYVFPDVSAHFGKRSKAGAPINSASDFAAALIDEAHVAVVPGEDFLGPGPRCLRFSFACSEEDINRGMTRLGEFLDSLT